MLAGQHEHQPGRGELDRKGPGRDRPVSREKLNDQRGIDQSPIERDQRHS